MRRHAVSVSVPPIAGDGVLLRRTTSADLPFLVSFFNNPAVYDIWDGHPLEATDIEAKYLGGRSPSVECFIVQHDGRDVGFVQYHVADDGAGGGMDLSLLPEARGRRLGTVVVRALLDFVQSELGWNRFTVDPDLSNVRGVNFWKKVGFVPVRIVEDEPGREPYVLLEWPLSEAGG
jgi:RimJ/RimL family protein N-acetyltransferase